MGLYFKLSSKQLISNFNKSKLQTLWSKNVTYLKSQTCSAYMYKYRLHMIFRALILKKSGMKTPKWSQNTKTTSRSRMNDQLVFCRQS